ncbi:MAG: MCE family protein [Armatimonadetes bacterium]|nr:MCE family protein [Armatimonadota bacterium]
MQGAAKVGALVLVFLALLYGAFNLLGRSFLVAPKTTIYYAYFKDAGGITTGTRILMSGVKIGTITKVELADPATARLTMTIDEGFRIPLGSTAIIPGSFLSLGESPLTILPSSSSQDAPPESRLEGVRANALDQMVPNSKETVAEFTKTLTAVRKLLEDQQMTGNIKELLKNSSETMKQFGLLAHQAQGSLSENRLAIHTAMASASSAMNNINEATQMVAKLLKEGKLQNQGEQIMANLNSMTKRADKLVASIDALINDPKLRDPAAQTAANIAEITTTGKEIAKNTEIISKNGAVVSGQAIELAKKAGEIEDEAKELVKKLKGFFDKGGSGVKTPTIKASMDVIHERDPKHWRQDANFSLPLPDSTIHLGIYDAFESNKINVRLGKPFSKGSEFLYGVYASKPSVGVDYLLAPRLHAVGDAFDLNAPRLDVRMRLDLSHGVVGWAGLDHVFKRNSPTFGIGVEK